MRRSPRKRPIDPKPEKALSSASATTFAASFVTPESVTSEKKRVKAKDPTILSQSRPTAAECYYATKELAKLHPEVVDQNNARRKETLQNCGLRDSIADGIVNTILSQNTTSKNSSRAFANLKRVFPTWDSLMAEKDSAVALDKLENAIRCGGLAQTKSGRIYKMFQTLQQEREDISFEYLRTFSEEKVKQELGRFPGMGPKTISCVLLFAMGRSEFPVDTHVHRISKQMGWIKAGHGREEAYEHLNAVIPADIKLDLHCLLVAHGKQCHRCAARGKPQFPPKDGSKLVCPLVNVQEKAAMINLTPESEKNKVVPDATGSGNVNVVVKIEK